ncbi:MAG: DUF1549 and DUF1553 domain-containing protein [Isosphaeraceae bacterium]
MRIRRLVSGGMCLALAATAGCGGAGQAPRPAAGPTTPAPNEPIAPRVQAEPIKPPTPTAPVAVAQLRTSPEEIRLAAGDPGFQLLAEEIRPDGSRRDVTGGVQWKATPEGVVRIERSGYVRPLAAGQVKILATLGTVEAPPVRLDAADPSSRPWDFAEDILPILTRAGCNAGGCHGRADGQNGFHLSIFGYDPASDYLAITRNGGGRRLSRLQPEQSLLLEKALGRVPHGGGQRLTPGSDDFRTLLAWLNDGAPEVRGKSHGAVESVRIEPGDVRLGEPGPQQLRVVATFADKHVRDVTRLASFRSNDDSVISVSPRGKSQLLRRAEADLVVRYRTHVVSTRLASVVNPDLKLDFATLKRRNFIDEELFKRLASLKVPPSPPASDAAFLRRVSLDLTGEQPQPDVVRQFLADKDPDKRLKLVDRLLASHEFVQFWKIKFGDLLQISSTRFGNGASYYHAWLEEQLQKNEPWDGSVRTLLTALGNPMIRGGGPVNYALDGPDAKASAEQTAQRFLGLRIRCAQCHDHPFDVWTQDDYFGLAAFFARVQRGGNAPGGMGRTEVKLNPKGTVEHLRTHQAASLRLLDGKPVSVKDDEDPRKALADWMTAPDNPYFARATANWLWAQFFGKGIADPPDDLSRSNPPVHPELLDALARHFVAHKFDLKHLIRTIVTSEAYGLSSGTVPGNEKDTRLFSHHLPRPLTAHQMADALAQATDVPNRFPNRPAQTRAIEVYDPATASTILDTFGRCSRAVGCASVSTPPLSLRQSLLLIGGDVIESKVGSLNGYLANLLELDPGPDEVVENLYLRVLCRPPSPEELSRWSSELKQSGSLREASEDLFWALLNSREFSFNH